MVTGGSQWTTELSGSARMFPKSRVESVSSSISPITALKINEVVSPQVSQNQPGEVRGHSHVVSSDDVKSQNHLLHPLVGAEHTLMTLIQDQVDGLVKAFQSALNTHTHSCNLPFVALVGQLHF